MLETKLEYLNSSTIFVSLFVLPCEFAKTLNKNTTHIIQQKMAAISLQMEFGPQRK